MDSNLTSKLAGIPAPMRAYISQLAKPPHSRYATAQAVPATRGLAAAAQSPVVDFVYSGLTPTDLTYDTSQYPVAGTFQGVMPPWLNDASLVPANWGWSSIWDAYNKERAAQVQAEVAYVQGNVPGQTYTATTTAGLIQQWYTQGMWDPNYVPFSPGGALPAPFQPDQTATLTQNWIADDAEFARQRLGGANPNVIRAADAGSYNVALWVQRSANGSSLAALASTLTAAQNANNLYVCDYTTVLGNAVKNKFVVNGRFLAAPICYFTVDAQTNALMPLAIQITGTNVEGYIFTPGDPNDPNGDAWLLAKLWAASADQQWWFSGSHLFNAHTIDMTFGIAALNQIQLGTLSATHPLVVLAQPFLAQVFDINNVVIAAPGTNESGIYQKSSTATANFCDAVLPTGRIGLYQVVSDLFKNYDFDANAFPAQMTNRGLQSGAIASVPFPYRDDGQVWWQAIQAFVRGIVGATYTSDAEVAADAGLNGWMNAAQTAFNHDGQTRFTWQPTMVDLTGALTNLLFTCSVQHTAVNDTMLAGWAFTPNGAFAMQAAPPMDAQSVTRQTVLSSLPNPQDPSALNNVIVNQIAFVMNGTAGVTPPDTLAQTSDSPASMQAVFPYAAGSNQLAAVTQFWDTIWTGPASVNSQITNNQKARIESWKGSTPVPNSLAYYYLSPALTPWTAPAYLNSAVMNQIQI
ncbi:lipoxygenase family protein [Ideonella sp.]|uniref:lipoxygenase family protein n=1 Tax=Ideonella sp. TaxID=1929293 RepID=UPI0035AF0801